MTSLGDDFGYLFVAISHGPNPLGMNQHPDPNGTHLKSVASALKLYLHPKTDKAHRVAGQRTSLAPR